MMLRGLFKDKYLYVKLWRNEAQVIDVVNGVSLREKSNIEFSNDRLLIANFYEAITFLKNLIHKIKKDYRVKRYNSILVHPMEFIEGGISEVELQIFLEVFESVGGKVVKVWDGEELDRGQVIEKLKNKSL
ncbi:hypothetical protein [Winogradskyella sp. MH6]|uniref:hypothetical protein n=1 Tax=Winogradskyella sp. MH6 TaxID=2929510 RepID=UPI001FB42488|nr:hypothetical protein [Winogradskyella sp. MH6]